MIPLAGLKLIHQIKLHRLIRVNSKLPWKGFHMHILILFANDQDVYDFHNFLHFNEIPYVF